MPTGKCPSCAEENPIWRQIPGKKKFLCSSCECAHTEQDIRNSGVAARRKISRIGATHEKELCAITGGSRQPGSGNTAGAKNKGDVVDTDSNVLWSNKATWGRSMVLKLTDLEEIIAQARAMGKEGRMNIRFTKNGKPVYFEIRPLTVETICQQESPQ